MRRWPGRASGRPRETSLCRDALRIGRALCLCFCVNVVGVQFDSFALTHVVRPPSQNLSVRHRHEPRGHSGRTG